MIFIIFIIEKISFEFRERRRLKKLRKDKIRQLSSIDDPNAKRHKHKHKCGDDLCKHRKHKKRRKHKKHHHRNELNAIDDPSNGVITKTEDNPDEGDFDEDYENESGDSRETVKAAENSTIDNIKSLVAKNNITKSVNIKINKITWPLDEDMISSITEDSSGSSYVSQQQQQKSFRIQMK